MLKRFFSGLVVLSLCTGLPLGAQREKKVYELIYQDIQAIKQQLLELNQRVQQNGDDIRILAEELGAPSTGSFYRDIPGSGRNWPASPKC